MTDDEELLHEFLVEGYENLDRLERELVGFEQRGASADSVSAIFRTIHTIKGTAGFFGFERLQRITHVAESLLSQVRDGNLELSSEIVTTLLGVVDVCRAILKSLEAGAGEGSSDDTALVQRLTELQDGRAAKPDVAAVAAPPVTAPAAAPPVAVPVPAPAVTRPANPAASATLPPAGDEQRSASDSSVRVDVALLDRLMDLAGELVLARNQLLKSVAANRDATLSQATQRIDLITSEMQEGVMKTRMQPISGLWNKLPRVVRDLAAELGKQVRLELGGKDTDLDRSILEAIKDPLTHLVRNAIDHGLERPERRLEAGKPAEGVLRLRASHEGGQVLIEISDDGAGIDPERIRRKALERGLVTAERATRMTETEIVKLIFAPGFSTAEQVTNVSGRGVGMDVVLTNIESIGGTVDVESRLGAGTTIRIKIPLTLAIIPALTVVVDGDRYALPQGAVVELVRIDGVSRIVEHVHCAPVYRLRGQLLPLVYLDALLGAARPRASAAIIVVVQVEETQFGIVVDSVLDTEEIVVKPLGKRLKGIAAYAGATILGDGTVALILDARGIGSLAGLHTAKRAEAPIAARAADEARPTAFLVMNVAEQQVAVPLGEVARLEAFQVGAVERAAGVDVVQYRGRMLPLLRLGDSGGSTESSILNVIVYTIGGRDLGLVVDEVVDIVEEHVEITTTTCRSGLHGSAVIGGRVTDVVDVASLARARGLAIAEELS